MDAWTDGTLSTPEIFNKFILQLFDIIFAVSNQSEHPLVSYEENQKWFPEFSLLMSSFMQITSAGAATYVQYITRNFIGW